jgi:hypothetical protein
MYFDKNRYPIYKGDLLKVFHFIGQRNKKYYMYKVVTEVDGCLCAVDVADLVLRPANPHRYSIEALGLEENIEIVQGSGPGDFYCFEQRERKKK